MLARLRRGLRELVVITLLAMAVVWSVDQLRKPSLSASFAATPLRTLRHETLDLATMSRERPLLVYLWATWCGVCRYTTPAVERLVQEGENVLTVALRSGDDQQLAGWLARKKLTMPVVNDSGGQLARRWQTGVTPTLLVISQGRVVSATSGWTSYPGLKLRLW